MTVIKVPKPPRNAYDPNRPVSALLKMQVEHLEEAERRLPTRYRSEVYINAIRTEGEAANYIRKVTEAIHDAHREAEQARRKPKRSKRNGPTVADKPAKRKPGKKIRGKKKR
jgi:hypothetical protein